MQQGVTDPVFPGAAPRNGSSYRNLWWPVPQRDCTMRTLMTEPSSIHAPGPATNSQEELVFEEIAEIAACSLALRQWERQHLPTEASPVGFELLMRLAQWSALGQHDRTALLKQLYLALPYSEKGVRLHLRRLEAQGWVKVQRASSDSRGTRVELSEMAWKLLSDYVKEWRRQSPPAPAD